MLREKTMNQIKAEVYGEFNCSNTAEVKALMNLAGIKLNLKFKANWKALLTTYRTDLKLKLSSIRAAAEKPIREVQIREMQQRRQELVSTYNYRTGL